MKIRKLHIKNYKQFKEIEFDFTDADGKTLDTIVLVGVNGSGKTNFLNFIADIFDTVKNKKHRIDSETIFGIEVEISIEDGIPKKEIIALKKHCDHLFVRENKYLYHNIGRPNDTQTDVLYSILMDIQEVEYKNLVSFEEKNTIFHTKEREKIGIQYQKNNWQKEAISFKMTELEVLGKIRKAVFKDINQAPVHIIKKVIDDINKGFGTLDIKTKLIGIENDRLVFSNGLNENLSFADLSAGEKQLFFQIFTLSNFNPQNSIFLIDEPEDALHPNWQREIIALYESIGQSNQIIIATHSPHILSSVKPESLFVLAIDEETKNVTVHNMAKEGKHSKGLDPNRILSEIMGAPLRDYQTQNRINTLTELIKEANKHPNGTIPTIESDLEELTKDLGRQDAAIMRFNHELLLLKRKKALLV